MAFHFPASLTILKTLCQATLMIACRLNLVLIGQATLNRYRLIRCSSGRIRSRHIQMLSCSHRNFCVCPWLTAVLSTACRRAGPACHCQCHDGRVYSGSVEYTRRSCQWYAGTTVVSVTSTIYHTYNSMHNCILSKWTQNRCIHGSDVWNFTAFSYIQNTIQNKTMPLPRLPCHTHTLI